jgi:hypothetical protein
MFDKSSFFVTVADDRDLPTNFIHSICHADIIFLIGKFKFISQFVTLAFKDHSFSLEIKK